VTAAITESAETDAWPVEQSVRYQLFQLLRLLETHSPSAPALGGSGPARDERIRLRPSTGLGFPCTETVAVETKHSPEGVARTIVTANISGLYGVGSPLPRSYAQQVLLQEEGEPQQRDFLDLIHHRVLSLWYRAFRHQRYELSFDCRGDDPLSRSLLDFIGISGTATIEELGTEPLRLLRYLGLFAARTRTAQGLTTLLYEELQIPIRVESAPMRWITLPKDQWPKLSSKPQERAALGRDLVIGSRHLDRMTSLRIHIGPVTYRTLLDLCPGRPLHARLRALARCYLRQSLDLTLAVQVPKAEMANQRIGRPQPGVLGRPAVVGSPQQDPVVIVIPASISAPSPRAERSEVHASR